MVYLFLIITLCLNGLVVAQRQQKQQREVEKTSETLFYPDDFSVYHQPPYHFHMHHNHPHVHRHPVTDESVRRAAPRSTTVKPQIHDNFTEEEIPLDIAQQISQYSVNDFLINFVDGYEEEKPTTFIQNRFGENEERGAGKFPKEALCKPELQTVEIKPPDDPTATYFPKCTRIERCGGCCGHPLLSCQPTKIEPVAYTVFKTQYKAGVKKFQFKKKEIVTIDRHLNCSCSCKLKAEHCSPFQEYLKDKCKCMCKNFDEETKCNASIQTMLWDPHNCICKCRNTFACTTGLEFDDTTCKCMPIIQRQKGQQLRSESNYDEYEN